MKRFLIILFFALVSCRGTPTNTTNADTNVTTNSFDTTEIDSVSNIEANDQPNDSTINIRFPKGGTSITVTGKMKGINHPITVYIPVKQGKQLTATLIPEDSTANIRFNQIFTPDGKADGPFGRELKRELHQQGTYKLIIGENLMRGEEWKGKFSLTVSVI